MVKLLAVILISISVFACTKTDSTQFTENFNKTNNRIWVGENFWSVPLEDWEIKNGRLNCIGERSNMRVNIISRKLRTEGNLKININSGLIEKGAEEGSAGFSIGLKDITDNSVKSLCYFGKGVNVGINIAGYVFIDKVQVELPENFSFESFKLVVETIKADKNSTLRLTAKDKNGKLAVVDNNTIEDLSGIVAIANGFSTNRKSKNKVKFWFDDFSLSGSMVENCEEEKFGPILWTMYTQSREKLKLTAQFPPIGENDNQTAIFEINKNGNWEELAKTTINNKSYTAEFAVNWQETQAVDYRVKYIQKFTDGTNKEHLYNGIIRQEPNNKKLKLAGMTCQEWNGFPYAPVAKNIFLSDPDILFFSGDQIYEQNGGYQVFRKPIDKSIINYLGKWYMFGWAFGNVMKDRPTVCLPDDHDVFQGNLWGNNGEVFKEKIGQNGGGYVMSSEMVNVVHRTQCSHLPDAYDPTPIANNISVYYTDMVYGGVSFAILSDRMFKSSPEEVATWKGRSDHITSSTITAKEMDKPGLKMVGDRQLYFMDQWKKDWKGAYMKVLLSQTIFANAATHHGGLKGYLRGDLDSGGWPRSGRNRIIERLRSCYAFHVCGDQHLPSLVQYGINEYRDASWVFCTPAINVGYQRRFLPDRLGWDVVNRPEHNLPNTGNYTDAFGNPSYIYAIGEYADDTRSDNRYIKGVKTTSGFGLVTFDIESRDIKVESYKFLADLENAPARVNQHAGWPKILNQYENAGLNNYNLPEIKSKKVNNPVVNIIEKKSGNLISSIRIKGDTFTPTVQNKGMFIVEMVDANTGEILFSTPASTK